MSCEIIDYSEKSCAVIGETKEHKENLKLLGCKFNNNLTREGSEEKIPGWIFSKKNRESIENYLANGVVNVSKMPTHKNQQNFVTIEEYNKLLARVAALEEKINN